MMTALASQTVTVNQRSSKGAAIDHPAERHP